MGKYRPFCIDAFIITDFPAARNGNTNFSQKIAKVLYNYQKIIYNEDNHKMMSPRPCRDKQEVSL
jgi:hypothetical protein